MLLCEYESCQQISNSGTVVVPDSSEKAGRTVVYARVSSSTNKSNLTTQAKRCVDFCIANGWVVDEVVEECASGVNDQRKKLLKIPSDDSVSRIVVEHKDRLTRFGFNFIETMFNGQVVVINRTNDGEEDIIHDFTSIITSFCARIYGKRRSKRKTEALISELNKSDD
jgi:predicted site-specific integrase-resolvase